MTLELELMRTRLKRGRVVKEDLLPLVHCRATRTSLLDYSIGESCATIPELHQPRSV